ncbi:spindle assembly checkpoint protein [Dacryopinax primogenitus]|uniref:Spindle assembly checkpoint protein n=1 Tax=Dacryopinax primogenitus (strain DJM 731) TaxID=1858805 RepID=M5FSP0_DACPD|nr:spindle assembly checkpoint protein [Dacryopinax primogenitus]EJU00496.1 spindle assembly checkpoint protein [Dacryopinax primogenitus]
MPVAAVQKTKANITLKGSTEIVTEFFKYAVNSILFNRGVYPADDFNMVKKYGLVVLVTSDEALSAYLEKILTQVREWLMKGSIARLVLAIVSKESRVTLERWQFDVDVTEQSEADGHGTGPPPKPESEINADIRAIIKQIVSSVTYLPTLSEPCAFNILAYTSADAQVPEGEWLDTDPHAIEAGKAEAVKLRSFSTNHHKVEAMVAYRYEG